MNIHIPKNKLIVKIIFAFFIGLSVLLFLFWYINKYIYKSKATNPEITFSLSAPQTVSIGSEFKVLLEINGRLTGQDFYISYDPSTISYFKDWDTDPTHTGVAALDVGQYKAFFTAPPIIENLSMENDKRKLHMGLVSTGFTSSPPVHHITLTFKAIKTSDQTTIEIDTTKPYEFVGEAEGGMPIQFDLASSSKLSQQIETKSTGPTETPTTPIPTSTPIPTATPTLTVDPNATLTPTPTATPIPPTTTGVPPTNTPAQTTPGTGVTSNITFDIRTQGLTEAAKKVNEVPVRVVFLKDETVIDERIVSMSKNGDGSWTGTSKYVTLLTGTDYTLLIKGPKHLQKKICTNKPSESIGGQYSCTDGTIRIQAGDNRIDLKGVTLLAGDLPLQNGIVDAVDIAYIRSNLGKSDAEIVSRGDLNYDGIVDSQDYGMIINALSFKYDEEE